MKYVKMLGLAAVAAAALMAFVGASSASATVLCKTTTTPCGSQATSLTASLKSGTKAVLKTSFKTIECGKSSVAGSISTQGADPAAAEGSITTLTFEECNCEVVEVKKNGSLKAEHISGTENATVKSSGAEVTTICASIFGKVHCVYTTNNTDLGTLKGGNPAILEVKEAVIPVDTKNSDAICPEESKWTATYEVTSPNPLYVEPS